MTDSLEFSTIRYEVRLLLLDGSARLFVTNVSCDNEATAYAMRLLQRHLDCRSAEVWRGMKLVRQL